MPMQNAWRQMPALAGREAVGQGEAMLGVFSDEAFCRRQATGGTGSALLQAALTTENLRRAFKRVRANKGAAGVDGLDINQTSELLVTEWPHIREHLVAGTYRPKPVRRVTISKPDGGERELGIPTVTDRLIQQALLQVLQPILDPTFSEHSYGFLQVGVRRMRFSPLRRMSSRGAGSWTTLTCRSSLTGLTMTS